MPMPIKLSQSALAESASSALRFTLERGSWYGLTMYPGYGGEPYHSPIRIDELVPLGQRRFELRFLNLGYAQGVQGFQKVLRTLRRANSHLVAEETEIEDRTYVIMALTRGWMFANLGNASTEGLFDEGGAPNSSALLALAG